LGDLSVLGLWFLCLAFGCRKVANGDLFLTYRLGNGVKTIRPSGINNAITSVM